MRRSDIDAIPREGDTSFRQRPIEPDRSALLVVDLQKGQYNEERIAAQPARSYLYDRIRNDIIPNGRRLLSACRAARVEIVYTVIECLTLDGRDRGLDYKISGLFAAKGSREAEVIDELAPRENEIIIPKTSSSLFNSTNFEYVLHNLGVEYISVMGILTDQCVETTVRDGCDRGFLMTVITDACATDSKRRHEESLVGMRGYCRQRSTEELLAELRPA